MHNLLSHNQLGGWKQTFRDLNHSFDNFEEQSDLVNDYYDCLIECDENQAVCKRICRSILSS